jgi:hypothetical protein
MFILKKTYELQLIQIIVALMVAVGATGLITYQFTYTLFSSKTTTVSSCPEVKTEKEIIYRDICQPKRHSKSHVEKRQNIGW